MGSTPRVQAAGALGGTLSEPLTHQAGKLRPSRPACKMGREDGGEGGPAPRRPRNEPTALLSFRGHLHLRVACMCDTRAHTQRHEKRISRRLLDTHRHSQVRVVSHTSQPTLSDSITQHAPTHTLTHTRRAHTHAQSHTPTHAWPCSHTRSHSRTLTLAHAHRGALLPLAADASKAELESGHLPAFALLLGVLGASDLLPDPRP